MPAQIATTEDLAALHSELRAIRRMLAMSIPPRVVQCVVCA